MADDRPAIPRRRFLVASVAGAVTATSGCLGDGGGGGDGSDDGGDGGATTEPATTETAAETSTEADADTPTATPTETPTATPTEEAGVEATGEVTEDEIDGIEVVEWTHRYLEDNGVFQVEVTIRNAGDQDVQITPGRHRVEVTMYDGDGSELADTYGAVLEDTDLPAGETRWVKANAEVSDPSAVARYEIRLVCGEVAMGGYCG